MLLRISKGRPTVWTVQTRNICRLFTVGLIATIGFAQTPTPPPDTAPLERVIEEVNKALDDYQSNRGTGADALPPLSSVEFDFKVTKSVVIGGSVNLFIFKIGGSHEKDDVNDVTYTYSVPKPKEPRALTNKKPPELREALAQTIQTSVAALKTAGVIKGTSLTKIAISIQYGVKWDGNGGISAPISFVTIGLSGDVSKNTVQSVKLTFGQ
ncbi:MAG: hypothetical protein ABSE21_16370 [Bryobacteraceae bacterium]